MSYPLEVRLRRAYEGYTAALAATAAAISLSAPFYMVPKIGQGVAVVLSLLAAYRFRQAWQIWSYRYHLNAYRPYRLMVNELPIDSDLTFVGQGFHFEEKHARRLKDIARTDSAPYAKSFWWQTSNPEQGNYYIHNVEDNYHDLFLTAKERNTHVLMQATTQHGKTNTLCAWIYQDASKLGCTVVVDPKGGGKVLEHAFYAAQAHNKPFCFLNLAHPELSMPYSILGSYDRTTEPASRLADELPSDGDSAVFTQFVWRYSYLVVKVLEAVEQEVNVASIKQGLLEPAPLAVEYLISIVGEDWIDQLPENKQKALQRVGCPIEEYAKALITHAARLTLDDELAVGLINLLKLPKEYYDKITQSAIPTLEKLDSIWLSGLLSPARGNPHSINWADLFEQDVVVYLGLDSQTDPIVARTVLAFIIADMNAKCGARYNLMEAKGIKAPTVRIHIDEAETGASDNLISLLRLTAGAGYWITLYAQTKHDFIDRLNSTAKAERLYGCTNTTICFRCRNQETAEVMTSQADEVELQSHMVVGSASDTADISKATDFSSGYQHRVNPKDSIGVTTQMIQSLPPGHFFMHQGAKTIKGRMPEITLPKGALSSPQIYEQLAQTEVRGWLPPPR